MEQYALFHFAINKNDKVYQFIIQPGSPWEDIEAILEEFKSEFQRLRMEATDAQAKKAAESAPVEAEIVS